MVYGVLGGYEVSSIQREVERSLADVSRVADKLETYKNALDRRLSEIDSTFSSLERAMADRVRELQRNAGKTSGYSSYSSADSNIKSERRKIDQLLDRIKDDARELESLRRQARSAREDVLPKFEKLERSHSALAKELESERRKSKLASAAAFAAIADEKEDDDSEAVEERIAEISASYERKISGLTERYEKRITELEKGNSQEEFEVRIKRLSDLLEDKKLELKKRTAELELLSPELIQKGAELEAERQKAQMLEAELSREKNSVANYKELLMKRTVAHLMVRIFYRAERYVIKWQVWFIVGIFSICFAVLLWALLADS